MSYKATFFRLWPCFLLWLISACAAETPQAAVQTHTAIPTRILAPSPTFSPETRPQTAGKASICTLQQKFKPADLPLDTLVRLEFVDENGLFVAGWGPRPTPGTIPTPRSTSTPGPTPVRGDFVISPRRAYYRGILNLGDGRITPVDPHLEPLNNPCGEKDCAIEVVDQSPDGQWQLLHIWASGGGAEGAWLVGRHDARRLGSEPFVPFESFWQWSQDGTLLWYRRVGPGYGLTAETILVQLDSPPVVQQVPVAWDEPLDANAHRPAFSPLDKTIYSLRRFEADPDHFEWPDTQLYTFDVTRSLTQPLQQETVPHLVQITWNEATQSFWQVFAPDEGVIFKEMNSGRRLSIPPAFFEAHLTGGSLELVDILPQAQIAIDPAGGRLLLNFSGRQMWLFACDNEN